MTSPNFRHLHGCNGVLRRMHHCSCDKNCFFKHRPPIEQIGPSSMDLLTNPIWICKQFSNPTTQEKSNLIELINESKKSWVEGSGHNFEVIGDSSGFFKSLYEKFLNVSFEQFGQFTLSPDNSDKIWAYCSTSTEYASVWHDHTRTSTINSVYYLSVPSGDGGEIEFILNGSIFSYKPEEGDLLVFPDCLVHRPTPPLTKGWRISINMEIKTVEKSTDIFLRHKKLWE